MAFDLESMRHKFTEWTRNTRGKPPAPGEFFESYIAYIYESILSEQARSVSVTRGARITDQIGASYNIDVLYEFEIAGVVHRVALECKDTSRPIDRDEAIAFVGKLRHMPSTIGVFVSRSGYQRSASEYLDNYGVAHFDGNQIPNFGQAAAARLAAVALPPETAAGEPFWSLMEYESGTITGNWYFLPRPGSPQPQSRRQAMLFPLFISRRHAKLYMSKLNHKNDFVIRGIRLPTLRFIASLAERDGQRFGIMQPIAPDGEGQWICKELSPQEVIRDYVWDREQADVND